MNNHHYRSRIKSSHNNFTNVINTTEDERERTINLDDVIFSSYMRLGHVMPLLV